MSKLGIPVVAAVALIAALGSAAAQSGNETPQQNVRASRQYEQLVCTNKAFRAKRMAQECGPLQGSQFYDSCVASFNCSTPASAPQFRQTPPSETVK